MQESVNGFGVFSNGLIVLKLIELPLFREIPCGNKNVDLFKFPKGKAPSLFKFWYLHNPQIVRHFI